MKRIDANRILVEKDSGSFVDGIIYADNRIKLEEGALDQFKNATRIPGVVKVVATPDIHTGFGVPIGSVIGMDNVVIPAAVGYDVNCGMRLLTTPLEKRDLNLHEIAHSIRRDIPLGEGKKNVRLSKPELNNVLKHGVRGLAGLAGHAGPRNRSSNLTKAWNEAELRADIERIEDNGSMDGNPEALSSRARDRGIDQLGTLGGGNHFIEIQEVVEVFDERLSKELGIRKRQIVVMIHSGSRGLGHQVGSDYMPVATEHAKSEMPDHTIGFFRADSEMGRNYIGAMQAAANFAFANRQIMAMFVRKNFRHYHGDIPMPLIYDVPHNMAKFEIHNGKRIWVHRKGATRAFPKERMQNTPFEQIGQPVIIPGSMGTSSYLLVGAESAAESLFSVNHGAGRVMSRRQAAGKIRRKDGKVLREAAISDDEFKQSMKDVFLICENKRTIKEEAPGAYKDIDVVIQIVESAGLARRIARMKPLAVLKG